MIVSNVRANNLSHFGIAAFGAADRLTESGADLALRTRVSRRTLTSNARDLAKLGYVRVIEGRAVVNGVSIQTASTYILLVPVCDWFGGLVAHVARTAKQIATGLAKGAAALAARLEKRWRPKAASVSDGVAVAAVERTERERLLFVCLTVFKVDRLAGLRRAIKAGFSSAELGANLADGKFCEGNIDRKALLIELSNIISERECEPVRLSGQRLDE